MNQRRAPAQLEPQSAAHGEARLLVATLGHVDHGKTSLLRELTGTETDRLPDEKRRGISIELGYAELANQAVSFIDVPGHKKLVHTMIAGLGGVQVGLLVVAADDGVMPQTREHLQICRLAGLTRLVVALSKADLVDEETLGLAALDVESTLSELGFPAAHIIPTDIHTRRGIQELETALIGMRPTSPRHASPTWLAIDRVFSIKGAGTVVTGTLTRGSLGRDQEVRLLGTGPQTVRCRGLEVHGRSVGVARAPCRVAVNLALGRGQVASRGDALVDATHGRASKRLDVELRVLDDALEELASGASVLCHIGTSYRQARLTWLSDPAITAGEHRGLGHLALEAPLPVQAGLPLVLRGFRAAPSRGSVLAGGVILDAEASALPRRRERIRGGDDLTTWQSRSMALLALTEGRIADACESWLTCATPRPLSLTSLAARVGLSPPKIERLLRANPHVEILGDSVTTRRALRYLEQLLLGNVAAYHERAPDDPGMPREAAIAQLTRLADKVVAERVVTSACDARRLLDHARRLVTPEFLVSGGALLKRNLSLAQAALDKRGLQGASERELWTELGISEAAVRVALGELCRDDAAVSLGGLWFTQAALRGLVDIVTRHFARHPTLSVADLKVLAGVSRKQAVPLLEYLDRARVTRRQGNERFPYGNNHDD